MKMISSWSFHNWQFRFLINWQNNKVRFLLWLKIKLFHDLIFFTLRNILDSFYKIRFSKFDGNAMVKISLPFQLKKLNFFVPIKIPFCPAIVKLRFVFVLLKKCNERHKKERKKERKKNEKNSNVINENYFKRRKDEGHSSVQMHELKWLWLYRTP